MKRCERCEKKILDDQKGVCLHTFEGEKSMEKKFWHFQCYLDWLNENVEKKAIKIYQESMSKSIPMLKDLIPNIVASLEKGT